MRKNLLLGLISVIFSLGQAMPRTDSIAIRFNLSRSHINPSLDDNRRQLDRLVSNLAAVSDSVSRPVITVIGGASPEGPVTLNDTLSQHRAEALVAYINTHTSFPPTSVGYRYLGADWRGLQKLVISDLNVPARDEAMKLIDSVVSRPTPVPDDIISLKNIGSGRAYSYLLKKYFPALRESHVVFDYPSVVAMFPPVSFVSDTIDIFLPATEPFPPLQSELSLKDVCHPRYIGLKTNLLYDALALPNIGVDFYLGRHWSINASWTYGWWDKNSAHRYWRAYGGSLTVRRWFGKKAIEKPLTGHHIGIYGGVLTYDFEFGGKGYMGGLPGKPLWSRCNFMAGLEYGYSLPMARRLNLDFSIGIGWLGGKVIEYKPVNDVYVWEKTHRLNWIGPTKAEVSLVWLIGCGNYNKSKGGRK